MIFRAVTPLCWTTVCPYSKLWTGPKALFRAFEPCVQQLLVLPSPPPNQSIFIKGSLSSEFAFGSLRDETIKKGQCLPYPPPPPPKKKGGKEDTTSLSEPKANSEERWTQIFLSSQMHITFHLTLKVGSNPSLVTTYFILGWNRQNVWFGMKEGSEQPGCILYLSSFSSEYTWVLFNGPNGHWVTPGQPSNTLKSHNTQAQDFSRGSEGCWTGIKVGIWRGGGLLLISITPPPEAQKKHFRWS